MTHWVPELLAPAGSFEKMKIALLYGADAVYLGGQEFGLRTAAENFTNHELSKAVEFAHNLNKKIYVVLNGFLHDSDLVRLPNFVKYLDEINIDAVIVSDLGVVEVVKENSSIPIHLSTQASCTNIESARWWKERGVSRVVLGREVSVAEGARIKKEVGIEVEMFIHGSMCMAYSGNCVISNYTQGRDSNRGGCAHSCRFEYSLDTPTGKKYSYFMSSKDLEGIRVLPEFIDGKIDSLKVEGRMKGPHYAGTISKVYSEALSFYAENGHFLSDQMEQWEFELRKLTHRDYTTASLVNPADNTSIHDEKESSESAYNIVGVVVDSKEDEWTIMETRSFFNSGDTLEIVPFRGPSRSFIVDSVQDLYGSVSERAKPSSLIKLPFIPEARPSNLIRRVEV